MFDIKIQDLINKEIILLLGFIEKGIINQGFAQKTREQRISQEIETYTNQSILDSFKSNMNKFNYLQDIKKNNGSSKAPYELLLIFSFDGYEDVWVDLKPINIKSKGSAPFMGTIRKYIDRLEQNKFYDLYFIVLYESEVDKLPIFKEIKHHFVKDINNFTLYNNWQLQINVNSIKTTYGKNPIEWRTQLISLLDKFESAGISRIKEEIKKQKNKLNNLILS